MTNCQSNPDGTLHDNELQWLKRRAEGGYGIINTCCVHVQANGKGWEGELACFDDKHTAGYRRLAEGVHTQDKDTLLLVQIFHAGMRADDKLIEGPARTCECKIDETNPKQRRRPIMTRKSIFAVRLGCTTAESSTMDEMYNEI